MIRIQFFFDRAIRVRVLQRNRVNSLVYLYTHTFKILLLGVSSCDYGGWQSPSSLEPKSQLVPVVPKASWEENSKLLNRGLSYSAFCSIQVLD